MTTQPAHDGFALKWNAAEPLLASAEAAAMFIDDGAQHMKLVLAPGQLASGALEYTPFTDDVRFRLVAYMRDGREACESIRVLGNDNAGLADRSIPGRSARSADAGMFRMRVVSLEATQ